MDIEVSAEVALGVEVVCTGASEEHRWASTTDAGTHIVRLEGLLADTVYTCAATGDEGSASPAREVCTESLPSGLPSWTVTGVTDGYTLFNHWTLGAPGQSQRLFVVDALGRVRWTAEGPRGVLADLDVSLIDASTLLVSGASGHPPTLQTLDGEVTWTADGPADSGWFHHDARALPDGQVLALATAANTDGVGTWWGFAVERHDPAADTLVWRWDSQSAIDAGTLSVPPLPAYDPWHANAVTLDGDDLWVSLAYADRLLRIDVPSGTITGVLGRGGDWALVDADGDPLGEDAWFDGQHDPELEGERLLLYDNRGGGDGTMPGSRALELELDEVAATARVVWEWTEPGWYEPLFGDADRIDEERVRITMGHCMGCEPLVDPERRSAIVEVERSTGAVLWRLELEGARDGVYRSEYVAPCALFPTNRTLCP